MEQRSCTRMEGMGLALKTGFLAAALGLIPLKTMAGGWHVAIEENKMETPCSGQNISVDGAKDCSSAIAAAQKLFAAEVKAGCLKCASATNWTCKEETFTRPNGAQAKRWQVDASCEAPPTGPTSCKTDANPHGCYLNNVKECVYFQSSAVPQAGCPEPWKTRCCTPAPACPPGQTEQSFPGTTGAVVKYCCEGKPGADKFCCTKQKPAP